MVQIMTDMNVTAGIDLQPPDDTAKIERLNVVCEFVCDRIPDQVPDWIWVEHQGIEDCFYCLVDWNHPQLEPLLRETFDPTEHLLASVRSLGFINVDAIEWNAQFEHEE